MIEESFGKELERLRSALARDTNELWTQRRVAEKIGVTAQAYQNWIHGRRGKDIDLATLKKISRVLNGNFCDLVRLARPDIYQFAEEILVDRTARAGQTAHPELRPVFDKISYMHANDRAMYAEVERFVCGCSDKVTKGRA